MYDNFPYYSGFYSTFLLIPDSSAQKKGVLKINLRHFSKVAAERITQLLQDGAEPTDTFQMVIDNIWK